MGMDPRTHPAYAQMLWCIWAFAVLLLAVLRGGVHDKAMSGRVCTSLGLLAALLVQQHQHIMCVQPTAGLLPRASPGSIVGLVWCGMIAVLLLVFALKARL